MVASLSNRNVRAPQDRLNCLVIHSQPMKISRMPAPERMPAVPLDSSRLENWPERAPIEIIQREWLA